MPSEVAWELRGKPLAPKMHPGQKKNIKLDFLPPCLGTIFGTCSRPIWKRTMWFFSVFLNRQFEKLFRRFLLHVGCVFWGLAKFLGKSRKQPFCNLLNVKSQIPRVCRLNNLYILRTFLGLLPGAFFVVIDIFRCHFWLTFGAKT